MKTIFITKVIPLSVRLFILAGAISIPVLSLRYFSFEITGLLNLKSEILLNNMLYRTLFYLHIVGGVVALVTGFSQFWEKLRRKNMVFHRKLGRIYVAAVFISGLAAFIVAFFAHGGWISTLGFSSLAIVWMGSTYNGLQSILNKELEKHRRWMLRSYAITFSAVTFRIWLLVFPALGLTFMEGYVIAAWMPWLLNISIIEMYINRNNVNKVRLSTS